MTVIAADFIPIEPYQTTVVDIGMGQRYDVIITADQATTADSFWMRAIPQSACSENSNEDDIKGIIYYDGSTTEPTTSGYDYTDSCDDETENLVPYLSKTVQSPADRTEELPAGIAITSDNLFKWTLNSTSMLVEWGNPTLSQIVNGTTTWDTDNAIIELPNANEWVYVVVSTTLTVPHPIHLHGHDFYVLAQDTGDYSSNVTLKLDNPPRRDTAMLPSAGYLVLAFETDNPGAWLMHCHIGWHTSEGFAVQFIERYDEIAAITDSDSLSSNCAAWNTHEEEASVEQEDSGV